VVRGLLRLAMSCTLQDAGQFVQALVGPAPFRTILDCYRELLSICKEHQIKRVLVVSVDGDATTHAALAQALAAMARAGLAPDFQLAMVAELPATFAAYQAAERIAAEHRISACAFRTRREAVQWLTGEPAGRRGVSRP